MGFMRSLVCVCVCGGGGGLMNKDGGGPEGVGEGELMDQPAWRLTPTTLDPQTPHLVNKRPVHEVRPPYAQVDDAAPTLDPRPRTLSTNGLSMKSGPPMLRLMMLTLSMMA